MIYHRHAAPGLPSRIAALLLLSALPASTAGQDRTIVRPTDNGAALVNPGMGWVFHHYDNSITKYGGNLEPWDTVDEFPGVGVIYLRLAWAFLEPEEGKFNWSVVDVPSQRWIAKGKQIAFRFTCYESPGGNPNATPEWVVRAGAKVYSDRRPGKDNEWPPVRYEPDYDDPVFLEKLDRFLAAAAARYDGDPNVAFIDVGSIGIWGEGDPDPSRPATAATVRKHVDLHLKHFKRTLVVFNDNLTFRGKGLATMIYAKERGLALRDDSILCRPGREAVYTHYYAGAFWPRLPVILESEHYGSSARRGYWEDGSAYLRAVEEAHGSYVSVHWWPREFLQQNRELVRRINLRMGYRLQLLEASMPKDVPAAGRMLLSHRWRNNGVAPCLPGGFVAFTLKDDRDGIAGVFVDEGFDVRTLTVGPPDSAKAVARDIPFTLPPASILKPGTYRVYVSVGSRIGTPRIALPMDGEDGQKRYFLGTIRITSPSVS